VKARPQRSTSGEERWRVLFECVRREKDACEKTQGRYLDEDTRKVTTICRDREVWHALLHARGNHERSNLHERKRWHVSTDHHLVRRNRKGLRFQQLCGEIAILLTWLKAACACHRRRRASDQAARQVHQGIPQAQPQPGAT